MAELGAGHGCVPACTAQLAAGSPTLLGTRTRELSFTWSGVFRSSEASVKITVTEVSSVLRRFAAVIE